MKLMPLLSIRILIILQILDSKDMNLTDIRAKRVRRGGICNLVCSCLWGDCVRAPGYTQSYCCSEGYAWHCCGK